MAAPRRRADGRSVGRVTERCSSCSGDTVHEVSIRIVTESPEKPTGKYSREPYRATTCLACGTEESESVGRTRDTHDDATDRRIDARHPELKP